MKLFKALETKRERMLRLILAVVIVATIAFIFGNSTLTAERSSVQSGAVTDVIVGTMPTDKQPAEGVEKNDFHQSLRKVAHFAEYGVLGIEISLFLIFFAESLVLSATALPVVAVFSAFIDESIQLLSDRSPAVSDMWIDIAGFAAFCAVTYAVYFAVKARPVSRLIKFISSRKK